VSIGETLAEARNRIGLTVREVSERTRVRETIIRDIERDDYSSCGADFYARGHIRAIARVVDIEPAPLIEQYDQAHGWQSGADLPHPSPATDDTLELDGAAAGQEGGAHQRLGHLRRQVRR
jgi:cytoskeletal protein RodZ